MELESMATAAHDAYLKAVFGIDVSKLRSGGAKTSAAPAAAGGPTTAPAAGKNIATFAKARTAWMATRKKIEGDIGKLHGAFNSAFKGHPMGPDLGAAFKARADKVLEALDEALAHKLDAVTRNTDASQHAKLVQEAKQIMQRYEATVANDSTIAALDANPFAPLAIRKTLTATLSTLSKAIV
jgi:hypothetical protein